MGKSWSETIMKDQRWVFDEAPEVHGVASFFMLVSNTGTLDVHVAIENDKLSQYPKGFTYQERKDGDFFSHIDFYNPNVGSVVIRYVLSDGFVRSTPDVTAENMPVIDVSDTIITPTPIIALDKNNLIDNAAAVDKGGGKVGIPVTGNVTELPYGEPNTALLGYHRLDSKRIVCTK